MTTSLTLYRGHAQQSTRPPLRSIAKPMSITATLTYGSSKARIAVSEGDGSFSQCQDTRQEDVRAVYAVTDTGAGIAPENIGKLFYEIVQFDANALQRGGGSGFGLKISRAILEQHGAVVGVHSAGLGKGSTFYIILPVQIDDGTLLLPMQQSVNGSSAGGRGSSHAQGQRNRVGTGGTQLEMVQEEKSLESPPRPGSATTSDLSTVTTGVSNAITFISGDDRKRRSSGNRLLIVDDSLANRKIMGRLVKSLHWEYEEAEDGVACVERIAAREVGWFDAVLIDNLMPRMNGVDAVRVIRANGYSGLVVFTTGMSSEEEFKEFKLAGGDDVLVKPISSSQLSNVLAPLRHVVTCVESNITSPAVVEFLRDSKENG